MRQKRTLALSAVSVTAALLTAALPATPALAVPPITCGMTVTTNITLTRNLTCPRPGLIIGADNITINLAGHTLAGSGPTTSTHTGIHAEDHTNIRIQNGTITGFRQAIELTEVENAELRGLRITGNTPITTGFPFTVATVSVLYGQNIAILNSQITQPQRTRSLYAEHVRSMRLERIIGSGNFSWLGGSYISVTRSAVTDGDLFFLESGPDVQVRNNVLRRTALGVTEASATFTDNHFIGPINVAIHLSITNNPVVERNVITGAVHGVELSSLPVLNARIRNNVFRNNDYGVTLDNQDLIGGNLLVADNLFIGNRQAGIFIEAENVPPAGGPATITRNTLIRNGHESTDRDAAGRRINDGIHTNIPTGSPLTISHNRTYYNADHGIEALPTGSVIDGGDNQSTGDPNGCAGITCT